MKIETFSFTPFEYGAELTAQTHQTLHWLNRNGYLNNEDTLELLERMVVSPVKNQKKFGQFILKRFFGKESDDNCYVFPITMIESKENFVDPDANDGKPNLTVVK